jgi:hypothetical protein
MNGRQRGSLDPRGLAIAFALIGWFASGRCTAQDDPPPPGRAVGFDVERLLGRLEANGSVEPSRLDEARARIEAGDAVAAVVESLLRSASTELDEALRARAAGDPSAAARLASLAARQAETGEPMVGVYAGYHLGSMMIESGDPDLAVGVFDELLARDREATPLDLEIAWSRARALAEIPDRGAAIEALLTFLQRHPDAPVARREEAVRLVEHLQEQSGPLDEVADTMRIVGREIGRGTTGDEVQSRQQAITAKLEELARTIENQEKQQTESPSSRDNRTPASQSALPGGEGSDPVLGSMVETAERWGALNERERAAIEARIEERMPRHYRDWLEDYYRRLGRGRR